MKGVLGAERNDSLCCVSQTLTGQQRLPTAEGLAGKQGQANSVRVNAVSVVKGKGL